MNAKNLLWLLILIPTIALMGCEGDQGPAGAAGADGVDGEDGADGTSLNTCLECHSDAATLQVAMEYLQSGHYAGNFVGYAGARYDCAQCHSKQGFVLFAELDEVTDDVADPAAIDCATCHVVHGYTGLTIGDPMQQRLTGPVTMIWDDTYVLNFGDDSNMCANCHQTRRPEPNIAAPGETFEIDSTHYGPHHGPQANVLEGVGFAEIAGSVTYPVSGGPAGSHLGAGMTCIACHMDTYADGAGGHTWHPTLATCTSACHAGASDFDVNGFQTATQAKLDQLRDELIDLGVVEWVEEDEAYEPVVGVYPMVQAQAYFNWIGLVEDRSQGAHNPSYVDALLDNTLEALAN